VGWVALTKTKTEFAGRQSGRSSDQSARVGFSRRGRLGVEDLDSLKRDGLSLDLRVERATLPDGDSICGSCTQHIKVDASGDVPIMR